ncbi:MAG: putative rane protein [Herbinix sp.]|jgi:hypothetical protein|nr:putative rane protein [Herbinix sp.]
MNKKEFLEVLRQSLNGEVTSEVIEQNIKYYDQYISAPSEEEEAKVLSLLGDPRLIARTVIEADRAAKQKSNYTSYQGSHTSYNTEEENTDQNQERSRSHGGNLFFTNLKWYHKVMMVFAILIILSVIVLVGRLLIGFLFAFGLPIILILLVMALFRKRN